MQITLDTSDLDRYIAVLKDAPAKFKREIDKTTGELATMSAAEVRRFTPRRTGALASSIKGTVQGYTVTVGSDHLTDARWPPQQPLAPIVEYGTREHIIEPRRPGGVLAWTSGGETHFARWVIHPGTKGAKMFERGTESAQKKMGPIFEKLNNRLAEILGGRR